MGYSIISTLPKRFFEISAVSSITVDLILEPSSGKVLSISVLKTALPGVLVLVFPEEILDYGLGGLSGMMSKLLISDFG